VRFLYVGTRDGPEAALAAAQGLPFAGIAAGLLDETEVSGPVIDLAFQLYGEARATLGDGADYLEAIKVIEGQAGVEIRG